MLKVLNCVAYDHDLRLVGLSAAICALGCLTVATLVGRADRSAALAARRWLGAAAAVFGASVWSLHFVAMLAFMPGLEMAYEVGLTAASIAAAAGGAALAFAAGRAPLPHAARVVLRGLLLGLAVVAMHYAGVAAMSFGGFLTFDRTYVTASVLVSLSVSTLASARMTGLGAFRRRAEVAGWLALAICGLHFTGMAAVAIAPGVADRAGSTLLGTAGLAWWVGGVSLAVLAAGLAAVAVEGHLTQRALRDLGRLRLLSNLASEVLLIHREGQVLEINSAGERLFKAPVEELVGRELSSLFTDDSAPALARRAQTPACERPPEEFAARTVGGSPVAVELTCQPIDYLGRPATAVALRDLSVRRRDEERIRHLARHDALTGLPNRYNLQERLELSLDAAGRQGRSVALAYMDLDRFKSVNDLHGHVIGDALLVQVSRRVTAEIGSGDTLARVGGDEFVMVLVGGTQPESTAQVTMRVVEALRQPFQIDGRRIEIGASVGVSLYPQDGATPEALTKAADAAMYRAKDEGRGTVRFYEASMDARLQARLQLEQELAGAAERGELLLHYQPIVNGVTGELETFEALVRWRHPVRGLVPPAEFIPLAEESGLIDVIGRWVIDEALSEAAVWPGLWRVSVNVSPAQFRHTDLCATLRQAISAHGIEPSRVVIEVTEGVLIDDAAKAVVVLNRLRGLGVRVALDDFGSGFSSLSYLRLFKFDKFKVDRSFVAELGRSEDALTLVRSIVNLGHNLGLHVTVEGVETPEQLAVVRALGCDQVQGYLVGRPAPVAAFGPLERLRTKALFGQERARLSKTL